MPELPDLQVFSRNLEAKLKNKVLEKVSVKNKKKLKVSVAALTKALVGRKLLKVYRSGKELHFAFDEDKVLGLHLMLHGELYLFDKKNDHKFTIIELLFNDGTGLALTDFQGQATPTLNPEERDTMDAVAKEMNAKWLTGILSTSRATIKNVLLDQDIIRGIGNAYADEILWDAGISPFSVANKIPEDKIKDLAKSIKSVLQKAEKEIMKKHPDIISGEIRDFLKIHHTKNTESPKGEEIITVKTGSRKTYYTKGQKEYC